MIKLTREDFEVKLMSCFEDLYRGAFFLCKNPDAAKELRQKTVTQALEKWEYYVDGNFKGWICRIMYRLFLSGIKEHMRFRTVDYDECEVNNYAEHGISDIGNPESDMVEKQTKMMMSSVSKNNRIVLEMKEEGFTNEEIGEKLYLNTGAVKGRIFRGTKEFMSKLEDKPRYSIGFFLITNLIDSLFLWFLFLSDSLF